MARPGRQRREIALRHKASEIADAIAAMPNDPAVYLPAIPRLFGGVGKDHDDRYEVFRMLDEKYGAFGNWREWHGRLRQVRNHPWHGPDLFAVIRSGNPDAKGERR